MCMLIFINDNLGFRHGLAMFRHMFLMIALTNMEEKLNGTWIW